MQRLALRANRLRQWSGKCNESAVAAERKVIAGNVPVVVLAAVSLPVPVSVLAPVLVPV